MKPEILTHANIPKPLHLVNPRTVMGQTWWNKQRQKAYESTGFLCAACDVHKSEARYKQWLEAHELYEIDYALGTMTFKEIVPLCHACHNYIHCGRMQALVDQGKMSPIKMKDIKDRGDRLLAMAGLEHPEPPARIAKWSRWRLVFNGKYYPPKLKSPEEWMKHFGVTGKLDESVITDFDGD